MMRVVDFAGWHAMEAREYLQVNQQSEANWLNEQVCSVMEDHGHAQTAFDDDKILGFAGVIPI